MTTLTATQNNLLQVIIAHDGASVHQLSTLRGKIHGAGAQCDGENCIPVGSVDQRLAVWRPDIIIYFCRDCSQKVTEFFQEAIRLNIPVLVLGPHIDTSIIVDVLRHGAHDYIEYEDTDDRLIYRLNESFQRLAKRGGASYSAGRLVSVLSATAGTGVTTIASGLSFAMAAHAPSRISLSELGVSTPQLAAILDQKPATTLNDLAGRSHLIDSALVRQAMVTHPAGVDLLLQPLGELEATQLDEEQTRRLLTLLKVMYEHSVLDLAQRLTPGNIEAIRLSDTILLVCRLDVPGIRLTKRLLRELHEMGVPPSRIEVVFNRRGERGLLTPHAAGEALGLTALGSVANAPAIINTARNRGIPVNRVARYSTVTRELAGIASRLIQPR